MSYNNILLTVASIATITFNRPKALNAMNSDTCWSLRDVVTACKQCKCQGPDLDRPEKRPLWPAPTFRRCRI